MSTWKVHYQVPDSHIVLVVGNITASDATQADELAFDHVKEIFPDIDVDCIEVEEW